MSANLWPQGPWTHVDNSWEFSTVYDSHDSVLASVPIHHLVTEETQDKYEAAMEATARLIAAAPDLVEALQGAVDSLHFAADELSAANCVPPEDLDLIRNRLARARAALTKAGAL